MGDDEKAPLKLDFDSKVRVEFRGATITSDAGLLACRELDDALSLTDSADEFLKESRTGQKHPASANPTAETVSLQPPRWIRRHQ